jgi:hypothetical protein
MKKLCIFIDLLAHQSNGLTCWHTLYAKQFPQGIAGIVEVVVPPIEQGIPEHKETESEYHGVAHHPRCVGCGG